MHGTIFQMANKNLKIFNPSSNQENTKLKPYVVAMLVVDAYNPRTSGAEAEIS